MGRGAWLERTTQRQTKDTRQTKKPTRTCSETKQSDCTNKLMNSN